MSLPVSEVSMVEVMLLDHILVLGVTGSVFVGFQRLVLEVLPCRDGPLFELLVALSFGHEGV